MQSIIEKWMNNNWFPASRYEINNGDASWEEAEKQVRSGGASTVSVKSSKPSKRKKGESAREIYDEAIESKKQKIIKKGTEGRKGRSWLIFCFEKKKEACLEIMLHAIMVFMGSLGFICLIIPGWISNLAFI